MHLQEFNGKPNLGGDKLEVRYATNKDHTGIGRPLTNAHKVSECVSVL